MIEPLTPTERKVARMLGEGKAPRVIAAELGVATVTVRKQLYSVQEKIGAVNIVHLAVMIATGEVEIGQEPDATHGASAATAGGR